MIKSEQTRSIAMSNTEKAAIIWPHAKDGWQQKTALQRGPSDQQKR